MKKPKKIDAKEVMKEGDSTFLKEFVQEEKQIVNERKEQKEIEKKRWWERKSKNEKASLIIGLIIFILSLAVLSIYIFARQIFGDEIGDALFGKDIENGWVYFISIAPGYKWAATAVSIAVGFVGAFILNFIIKITTFEGKKAKTVGSIIRSLIKYIIVLIVIARILVIWGVDVGSILAGIGVITLIVGLGCQSLIQDVVSGLFIVFDDFYDVGDVVIIDGFRGRVSDIGLKSTKMLDYGGNEKSINNSSIVTVTNLSRGPSMVFITIPISYEEDVERVEAVIANALPSIQAKIPALTEGPYYKGVASFDDFGVQLAFLAFSDEDDRFQVTRDLNRELYLEFKKNGIFLPTRQISVNEPQKVDRVKASSEDKAKANELIASNRSKKQSPKKKTLAEKTKDVFFNTANGK